MTVCGVLRHACFVPPVLAGSNIQALLMGGGSTTTLPQPLQQPALLANGACHGVLSGILPMASRTKAGLQVLAKAVQECPGAPSLAPSWQAIASGAVPHPACEACCAQLSNPSSLGILYPWYVAAPRAAGWLLRCCIASKERLPGGAEGFERPLVPEQVARRPARRRCCATPAAWARTRPDWARAAPSSTGSCAARRRRPPHPSGSCSRVHAAAAPKNPCHASQLHACMGSSQLTAACGDCHETARA